jgi:heme A synthase
MGKLIAILLLGAAAYWYWSGPYQASRSTPTPEQQQAENDKLMKRCLRQEASMTAAAGMGGAMVGGGDAEALCAGKLGLYQRDGQWHKGSADDAY